jgi:hypothetical protein
LLTGEAGGGLTGRYDDPGFGGDRRCHG